MWEVFTFSSNSTDSKIFYFFLCDDAREGNVQNPCNKWILMFRLKNGISKRKHSIDDDNDLNSHDLLTLERQKWTQKKMKKKVSIVVFRFNPISFSFTPFGCINIRISKKICFSGTLLNTCEHIFQLNFFSLTYLGLKIHFTIKSKKKWKKKITSIQTANAFWMFVFELFYSYSI